MNESDFEQQLKSLRPARPSRELENRVARELTPVSTPRAGVMSTAEKSWLERLVPALGWCSLGAAAAVVAMLSMNLAQGGGGPQPIADTATSAATTSASPTPLAGVSTARSEVLEAVDEGLLEGGDHGLGRRVRYSSLERRSWKDETGAVTEIEIPREDVVLLPVSFQ